MLVPGSWITLPAMAAIDKTYHEDIVLPDPGANKTRNIEGVEKISVTLTNLLPAKVKDKAYVFSKNSVRLEFGKLSAAAIVKLQKAYEEALQSANVTGKENENPCSTIIDAKTNLLKATKESKVPDLKKALIKAIDDNQGSCDADIFLARQVLESTEQTITFDRVSDGHRYTLEVSRKDDNGEPIKWTYEYKYDFANTWITHVGLTFLENKNNYYFTEKESGSGTSSYIINKENRISQFSKITSIMFTYLEKDKIGSKHEWAPTVGLGYDNNQFSILTGVSWVYGTNIMVTGGLAIAPFDRLAGKYHEDQQVSSAKSRDELKTTGYDTAAFISVTFRFDQSPFKP